MARVKNPRILVCRYCGDECDASNRDVLSGWTHGHPSVCPYRKDEMPSLNGVHVGDVWRNLHTGRVSVIEALKLGGCGTYTDREPVAVLRDEEESEYRWVSPHPLWSLVEHWEPLTRPGEYPVPWTRSRRWRGRSALLKWRSGGIRGSKSKRRYAYYHSYLASDGTYGSKGWGSNWQVDPKMEAELEQKQRMLEAAQEFIDSGDETLARVGARILKGYAEAA